MAYGIDELERRNPLAWPGFATEEDVKGLVPTIISVNECDPLRDEGVELLSSAAARRRHGALPPGDGHDPRHGDLPDRVPGDQPRHRGEHRGLLPQPA